MSISGVLQQFKGATKLVLNERSIDDKGACEVAKFLQLHGKIQYLELKSNDISGIGFAEIFRGLLKNPNIRQIVLEYNRLGEEGENIWPNYFYQLIQKSLKLERLNISNNKLNRRGFAQMRTCLANSKSLKLLEIKYNQIPSTQIASFTQQLKNYENDTLLYVDLSGNKTQKQIVNNLQKVLKPNREKNPISKDSLMTTTTGGFFNRMTVPDNTLSLTKNSFNKTNAIDQLSKENIIKHLEDVLEQNRKGTLEMKNKLEAELGEMKKREVLDAQQISQLDKKCNQLIIENRNLKYELDKSTLQNQQLEREQQFQSRSREQRILEANRQLKQMQQKYEEIENKMNREHDMKIKEINRNWQNRLRQIEEKIREVENSNNVIDNQIKKNIEKRQKLRVEYQQQEQMLMTRVKDEQQQKYRYKIQILQSRLQQIQQTRQKFYTRGQDILYQLSNTQKDNINEIANIEDDIKIYKIKQEDLLAMNKNYVERNDTLKQDINMKEICVEKLEEEINRINQEIQLRKIYNKEQLDKIIIDGEYNRVRKLQQKQLQIQKLNNLETALRSYQLQNAKLEQQYMLLQQRLQGALSKTVQDVFLQNSLY